MTQIWRFCGHMLSPTTFKIRHWFIISYRPKFGAVRFRKKPFIILIAFLNFHTSIEYRLVFQSYFDCLFLRMIHIFISYHALSHVAKIMTCRKHTLGASHLTNVSLLSSYGGRESCAQGVGGKTRGKEAIGETKA
jgi:hypothetical protein